MNIYTKLNEKQRKLIEETGNIIENREYSEEELKRVQNVLADHIFNKSKNEIGKEMNKFMGIFQILE